MEVCAGAENYRLGREEEPRCCDDTLHLAVFHDDILNHALLEIKVWRPLQGQAHRPGIGPLVRLGPQGLHGGALAAVQQPHLKKRQVRSQAHLPAQGIDLSDQMPLGRPADGRIAVHHCNIVKIGGKASRLHPHPRSGQGRLHACVPGANHNHVVCFGQSHDTLTFRCRTG